jgi:hypothetical protein
MRPVYYSRAALSRRQVLESAAMKIAFVVTLLASATALAQGNPKFDFAKPEEVKVVEWKAQAKGGFVLTTGNSQTKSGTFAAAASRKQGNNKLALEGAAAYGQSDIIKATTSPTDTTMITGIERSSVVTTNNWLTKGRYDRFFTLNNAGYVSAQAAADKVAGKSFYGGGQIGYSRQLYKSDVHLAVAELGYDLSYERYVQQPGKTLDPITIHSARLFVGETAKLSEATGATASVETLFNLNSEPNALNVSTGMPGVAALKDTRVVAKLGLTTTLAKRLSIGFGFTLKYDQNPAALPIPPLSPAGAAYVTGFQPFADKVDTLTEINLIYTFL